MRVRVLGGCGAWPGPGQACSGYLVEHDDFRLLIDPGYATLPRLLEVTDAEAIDAVLVSHGHPDHCADLHPLLRARALRDDPSPALTIHTLPAALDRVLALDRPGMLDEAYAVREFVAGERFEIGPYEVRTWMLPHFVPNAGLRLTAGGQTLAYTGDSGPSPNLADLARGADLFLAEATFADGVPADSARYLSSARQAGENAARAEVGHLLLTHLMPGSDPLAAEGAARLAYDGTINVAAAGTIVDLDSRISATRQPPSVGRAQLPRPDEREWHTELRSMADLITPVAVRVAATLRIADYIVNGPRTAPELAEAMNANADALDRVMRHLATAGVLNRDPAGRYTLTSLGQALRDDHPEGLRTTWDLEGAVGRAELSLVQLLHTVRTGKPAYPVQFGRSFWEDIEANPALAASFDAQMGSDVAGWAPPIISAYDWGTLEHVVDVGGGDGTLLTAILTEYTALRGTVVDLPAAADKARKALTSAGLADRAEVVAGSFFDPLPRGAGGYLLSAILHNWNDEGALKILRRCAEAADRSGRVFVVEKIGSDGESVSTEMDLRGLAWFGGRERNVIELTALAADSGLRVGAVHPAGDLSIVELSVR